MSQTEQTTDEVFDSLTGHDEEAIRQHFGRSIADLIYDPGMYRRSLIFVMKRRGVGEGDGMPDDDARNSVLEMRMDDVLEFFPKPDEKSGKDGSKDSKRPAPPSEASPPGASEPGKAATST